MQEFFLKFPEYTVISTLLGVFVVEYFVKIWLNGRELLPSRVLDILLTILVSALLYTLAKGASRTCPKCVKKTDSIDLPFVVLSVAIAIMTVIHATRQGLQSKPNPTVDKIMASSAVLIFPLLIALYVRRGTAVCDPCPKIT